MRDTVSEMQRALARHRGHWGAIALAAGVAYNNLTRIARGVNTNPTALLADQVLNVIDRIESDPRYLERIVDDFHNQK